MKGTPRLNLNPSSAYSWSECTAGPGYVFDNWDKCPDTTDTKYSDEGTTAHELAAAYLENRKPDPKEYRVEPTVEMRSHAFEYAEYVRGLLGSKSEEIIVEKKFPLWYMPERNAKVDAAIASGVVLHIVDFKYGEGVAVEAENNLQGAIYARAVVEQKYDIINNDFPIEIHIFQPRIQNENNLPYSVWKTTWKEIYRLTEREVTSTASWIIKAHKGDKDCKDFLQFAPSKKTCQWCPAKTFCVARAQSNQEKLSPIADKTPEKFPLPANIEDAQLAKILRYGPEIIQWIKDSQEFGLRQMLQGKEYEGVKLGRSKAGHRFWRNPKQAAKLLLETTILERREVYEEKIISPAVAEKLVGKNKMNVELTNLIERPLPKPIIIPAESKEGFVSELTNDFQTLE